MTFQSPEERVAKDAPVEGGRALYVAVQRIVFLEPLAIFIGRALPVLDKVL